MALATQCPFCQTVFRVAGDQLKLRGGLVRCGKCNEVFDGGSHLYPPAPGAWPTLPKAASTTASSVSASAPAAAAHSAIAAARANAAAPHYGEPPPAALPDAATLADIEAAWALPPSDEIDPSGMPPDTAAYTGENEADAGAALMIEDDETPDAGLARPFAGLPLQPSAMPHDTLNPLDPRKTGASFRSRPQPPSPSPSPHRPVEVDFDNGFRIDTDETSEEAEAPEAARASDASGDERREDSLFDGRHEPNLFPERTAVDGGMEDTAPAAYAYDDADNAHPEVADSATVSTENVDDGNLGYQPVEADYMVHQLGFVRQAQRQERWRRIGRIALVIASIVLLLAAAVQGIYLGRNRIAASLPSTRPLLEAACVRLQCSVGLQRQIDQLSIESNDLQASAPGQPALTLQLLLRNRSDTAQVWPHIELTLNDNDEKPLIRKVISPADYLAATLGTAPTAAATSILRDKGMAPNSEQPVKLSFVLPQAIASGYRIYLFYP